MDWNAIKLLQRLTKAGQSREVALKFHLGPITETQPLGFAAATNRTVTASWLSGSGWEQYAAFTTHPNPTHTQLAEQAWRACLERNAGHRPDIPLVAPSASDLAILEVAKVGPVSEDQSDPKCHSCGRPVRVSPWSGQGWGGEARGTYCDSCW